MVLQFDLPGGKDGLAAIPVILQDHVVHDKTIVETNRDALANQGSLAEYEALDFGKE